MYPGPASLLWGTRWFVAGAAKCQEEVTRDSPDRNDLLVLLLRDSVSQK